MVTYGDFSLERMVRAVEKVRERLLRATAVLDNAQTFLTPWPAVMRLRLGFRALMKRPFDSLRTSILSLRRADFPAVVAAMEAAGFYYAEVLNVEMFLDGPNANPRDAVHILFAGEKRSGPVRGTGGRRRANRKRAQISHVAVRIAGADEAHIVSRQRSERICET